MKAWKMIPLALIFFSFYILGCVFQAYCCAYQDCPYIGGWCPGLAGIIPASRIARMLYGKTIKKTTKRFALFGTLAFCSLIGLGVFPLYWLGQRAAWLAVAYFVLNLAYYTLFLMTVCPVCAIRNTCPGGKCHQLVLKGKEEH